MSTVQALLPENIGRERKLPLGYVLSTYLKTLFANPTESNVGQCLLNLIFVVSQLRCLYSTQLTSATLTAAMHHIHTEVILQQLPTPSPTGVTWTSPPSTGNTTALDQRLRAFWNPTETTPSPWLGDPNPANIYRYFQDLPANGGLEIRAKLSEVPFNHPLFLTYTKQYRSIHTKLLNVASLFPNIPISALSTYLSAAADDDLETPLNTCLYLVLWLFLLVRRWHWLHLVLESDFRETEALPHAFPLFPCLVSGHRPPYTFSFLQPSFLRTVDPVVVSFWNKGSAPAAATAAPPLEIGTEQPIPMHTRRRAAHPVSLNIARLDARQQAVVKELYALISNSDDFDTIARLDATQAHPKLIEKLESLADAYPNLALMLGHRGIRTLMHKSLVIVHTQMKRNASTRKRPLTNPWSGPIAAVRLALWMLLYMFVMVAHHAPAPPRTLQQFIRSAQTFTFTAVLPPSTQQSPQFSFYPHGFYNNMSVPSSPPADIALAVFFHEYEALYRHIHPTDIPRLDFHWVIKHFVMFLQPDHQREFWNLWANLPVQQTPEQYNNATVHGIRQTIRLIDETITLPPKARNDIKRALSYFRFFVCDKESHQAIGFVPLPTSPRILTDPPFIQLRHPRPNVHIENGTDGPILNMFGYDAAGNRLNTTIILPEYDRHGNPLNMTQHDNVPTHDAINIDSATENAAVDAIAKGIRDMANNFYEALFGR